ncbi:MAG: PIN domain-containing protein [Pseudoxanthomonas sp.]
MSSKTTKLKKLLFVDTNIWLDFYRARNDAGLALLKHAEAVSDSIIVTYQLESEFKKNRQAAIIEGMQELKPPGQIPRPAIFSDAKSTQMLNKSLKEAEKRVKELKSRLSKALENPTANDAVYQACQRIFHKTDALTLTRDDPAKLAIRRKAFRRYLHGCPPRKKNDTSFGDAFNWEWMVACANSQNAELVIVSRDSDFGATFDNKVFVNDHLRQEFSERVSKKRKLLLYTRLSEALKHFAIPVTESEVNAEKEIVETKTSSSRPKSEQEIQEFFARIERLLKGGDGEAPASDG